MAILNAKIEQYANNGIELNYENLIGYNGILQEKVPQIENWVDENILLYSNYYFQITQNLKVKQVNFDTNYKCIAEMKADKDNLSENDIVSTMAYYENGSKRGAGVYLITTNIGNLTEDDGRVIKIDNSDLYAVLQMSNNGINVMQYGCYGDAVTDDTIRLQKLLNMIYQNGGGTVYFPEGSYIVKIQENTGYSSSRACLTILGSNINLVGSSNSEIKQVGFNGGDLSDDYLYDESVGKYYRGHLLMFGSTEEPTSKNITIRGLTLNGGASTMPTYSDAGNWDGKSPLQWDITHKGIYFFNGANSNNDNLMIKNCYLKNFRGEAIYGGEHGRSNNIKIINTEISNSVTGISMHGIELISRCTFKDINYNAFESYITKDMIFEDCKFEDCNRGINRLNNKNWTTDIECEIKNCMFNNIEYAIFDFFGGNSNIHDNVFCDCLESYDVREGYNIANVIYSNNKHIINSKHGGVSVRIINTAKKIVVENNQFVRSEQAISEDIMNNGAIEMTYASSDELYNTQNVYLNNNYVEEGYTGLGGSNIDAQIEWNPNRKCNFSSSYGGVIVCHSLNKVFTTWPYDHAVYRPVKIDVSGIANEDCLVTIKVEYYNKNLSTSEEIIYKDEVKKGEDFNAIFEKDILMSAITHLSGYTVYPAISIYNDLNSETAISATYTLKQN